MEGPAAVVEFADNPNADYYMCSACYTHIALHQDFRCIYINSSLMFGCLFQKAVNVRAGGPERWFGIHKIVEIHCIQCHEKLGWKYIEAGPGQFTVRENYVNLKMSCLLRKRGNQIAPVRATEITPEIIQFEPRPGEPEIQILGNADFPEISDDHVPENPEPSPLENPEVPKPKSP